MRRHLPVLSLLVLAATTLAKTQASPASPSASSAAAPDVAGRTRRPLDEAWKQGKTAAVLFFVTTDCPIANRFAPEINRICRDYGARKLAFYIVQVDALLKAPQAAAHAKAYGFTCPVLLDRRHELVRFCGAHVTPEVAVVSTQGKILYRGRIDDRYASLGKPRLQPSKHDLRLALDAVCAGKPVATPRTTATGCYIEG